MKAKPRILKLVAYDSWDRPVYKDIEDGAIFKDVNLGKGVPELHSSSNNEMDGEPDMPLNDEYFLI